MKKAGATSQTGTKCIRVEAEGVLVEDGDGVQTLLPADTVVAAAGRRPLAELRDSFRDCAFDVINVGDCAQVDNIPHAIRSGYDAALRI